jgi:hypothetical protein
MLIHAQKCHCTPLFCEVLAGARHRAFPSSKRVPCIIKLPAGRNSPPVRGWRIFPSLFRNKVGAPLVSPPSLRSLVRADAPDIRVNLVRPAAAFVSRRFALARCSRPRSSGLTPINDIKASTVGCQFVICRFSLGKRANLKVVFPAWSAEP